MTSTELHDLVAGPYLMPNGSTRRGLWERVPALRPKTLWAFNEQYGTYSLRSGSEWRDYGDHGGTASNIALIRVAVEDWICAQPDHQNGIGLRQGVGPGDDDGCGWWAHIEGRRMRESTAHWHLTAVGALVGAAHDVADTLGVAP